MLQLITISLQVQMILPCFAWHINSHLHYDYPCYYLPLLQYSMWQGDLKIIDICWGGEI